MHATDMRERGSDAVSLMDIEAFVDGELDEAARRRVQAHISRTPEARRTYEFLLRQRDMLREWWKKLH